MSTKSSIYHFNISANENNPVELTIHIFSDFLEDDKYLFLDIEGCELLGDSIGVNQRIKIPKAVAKALCELLYYGSKDKDEGSYNEVSYKVRSY
jgi:hypothetical protein